MAFLQSHDAHFVPVQHAPRNSDFDTSSEDYSDNFPAMVEVPSAEYVRLITTARQYANLCRSLISGGIDNETINILSNYSGNEERPPGTNGENGLNGTTTQLPNPTAGINPRSRGLDPTRPPYPTSYARPDVFQKVQASTRSTTSVDPTETEADSDLDSDNESTTTDHTPAPRQPGRPTVQREADRTLQLSNLPEEVTHADITAVVRGGQILDVFLRRRNGTASISFLHAKDAVAYYRHVCKHDVYIGNKRIEISWNDRQFVLPASIAHKVVFGATRNLVIKRCNPNLTEESIREDLDHIHNLVVIKVTFIADNCYIATNSVTGATFARTCMMSRQKYKGSRIEWDIDECAQSLDRMPVHKFHMRPVASTGYPPAKKHQAPPTNRFELLGMGDVSC